jgi:3-oxoacyl-[acyl-carrier-protein] synthase II
MMEAFVTGVGWVTAAGRGRGREERFSWGQGQLPSIARKDIFADPRPHFGRMDRFSKLGLAAVAMALRDAGIESGKEQTIGVIASTINGCIDTDRVYFNAIRESGAQFASPHLFVFVSGNTFLGEASIEFNLTGPTFLLNEREPSRCAVLSMGVEIIATNQSNVMVAGICDIAPQEPCESNKPISQQGALFVVLEKDPGKDRLYGALELNKGRLFFEGTPFDDMTRLAARLSEKAL